MDFCFFSSRSRHTICALVTGVQTCALPISEFGRPDRLWLLSEQVRQDLDPGHIRRLALIRRHTQRRVALEMFDRAEILARGELHVARGHTVLDVDPCRPRARIAISDTQRRYDRHPERRLHVIALPPRAASRGHHISYKHTT